MKVDREFKPIAKRLQKLGYSIVTRGHKGHAKVLRPDGTFVASIPSSCSDVRALRNFTSELRSRGVPL